MSKPIYIAPMGHGIGLQSGAKIVAIRPPCKGEKYSMCMTSAGKFVRLEGQRINGVGVERYLLSAGYTVAQDGDSNAATLQDRIDIRDGIKLVEDASQQQASALQSRLGGKMCTYVPFDPTKPIAQVVIKSNPMFQVTTLDLGNGINMASVQIDWDKSPRGMGDLCLSNGWIGNEQTVAVPRNTEYGGPVELAAFIIANVGLGTLQAPYNLVMAEDAQVDAPYPRGMMVLSLSGLDDNDTLVVGIDAGDELVAQYLDATGTEVCRRSGIDPIGSGIRLCDCIGAIAGVLVKAKRIKEAAEHRPAKGRKAA